MAEVGVLRLHRAAASTQRKVRGPAASGPGGSLNLTETPLSGALSSQSPTREVATIMERLLDIWWRFLPKTSWLDRKQCRPTSSAESNQTEKPSRRAKGAHLAVAPVRSSAIHCAVGASNRAMNCATTNKLTIQGGANSKCARADRK